MGVTEDYSEGQWMSNGRILKIMFMWFITGIMFSACCVSCYSAANKPEAKEQLCPCENSKIIELQPPAIEIYEL